MAMHFDLVDLQLFIAVAETRSITNGAQRVHLALASASERIKGLEAGAWRCAADARPPRRRADAGRRKPARSCPHRHPQCRCDARRSCWPLPAASRPPCASLANTSGLSEYLPKALAAFLGQHPHISIDVEERESGDIAHAIADRRRRSRPCRRTRAARQHRAHSVQRRPPGARHRARRRTGGPAAGRFQRGGGARLRRADHFERAARPCHRACGAARRAACAFARG